MKPREAIFLLKTCNICERKRSCKKLCIEAERFVNQDYVRRKDRTILFSEFKYLPEQIK